MAEAPGRRKRSGGRTAPHDERGLWNLVGAGSSQVGVSGALRARDAARPTEADEAAAEREVRLIRRNYVPPASGSSGSTRVRS